MIELFKKGSGIHIKPENKGKFTETMKRTGKSATELSHSKNPLTRKRAIFALNVRKWKHQNGGDIEYYDYFSVKENKSGGSITSFSGIATGNAATLDKEKKYKNRLKKKTVIVKSKKHD